MQQGRAAFTVLPFARFAQLNRPDQSKFPGQDQGDRVPDLASAQGQGADGVGHRVLGDEHPGQCARQGPRLELHPRHVEQGRDDRRRPQRQRPGAASRPTTDRDFAADQPLAAVEAKALAGARVPLPAFPEAARAQTIFLEEVQLAVLGRKTRQGRRRRDHRAGAAAAAGLSLGVLTGRCSTRMRGEETVMAGLVVAVDVGSTSARAGVFDARRPHARARPSAPFDGHRPRPDHAEHDSDEIWRAVCAAVRERGRGERARPGRRSSASPSTPPARS